MSSKTVPQSIYSSYAPRLRTYNNSLIAPVLPSAVAAPNVRTTKRGTTIINYAEDGYDYDDDDDSSRRRPTGLRSLRRDDTAAAGAGPSDNVGKETSEPVKMQGNYRDWMGKTRSQRSDLGNAAQSSLPLTLIPIRLDIDIPAFTPMPHVIDGHRDGSHPLYKPQEPTLPYKLKDTFLWNLHETLITTDQFAINLCQDLDLPMRGPGSVIALISQQIRTQLEEYAGVALHPLFHSQPPPPKVEAPKPSSVANRDSATPIPQLASSFSRAETPLRNSTLPQTPSKLGTLTPQPTQTVVSTGPEVAASASAILPDDEDYNPDDTYRCIVNLTINLSSQLYTDKFEWSLLHPPGTAEMFAKQTCSDLGLAGEWVPAMTHAIYEAVLRLKKEACEAGGLVAGFGAGGPADFPNDAAISAAGEGAGWRYDPEHMGDEWEPKVEFLSKEEIEKREGDRERQLRRLRRETARFSSNAGMIGGVPVGFGFNSMADQEEERMGRGERSKKKKRFRSLSPLARAGTPGGRGTPDVGPVGGYGGGGSLTDAERAQWRCDHCKTLGSCVWAVRDGPRGPRVSQAHVKCSARSS